MLKASRPPIVLDQFEQLVKDTIFGNKQKMKVVINDFVPDLINYEAFQEKFRKIVNYVGLSIYDEDVKMLDKKQMLWTFVVKNYKK